MKQLLVNFYRDEDGLETIEIVILLVVIVGIAFAFRKTLVNWFNSLMGDINNSATNSGTPTTSNKLGN